MRVMRSGQHKQFALLAALWVVSSGYFWLWWLRPAHVGNPVMFVAVSVALFYSVTLLPSFYIFYLSRMRRPLHVAVQRAEEAGVVGRVAVVTLTVPGSESLEIVRRQLEAIASIEYPHDSWILVDKEHSPMIEALAAEFGVSYFCRHDDATWGAERVSEWNSDGPPFQAKTKAGNVNSWIDAYGHDYSHFTQFDIDHRPVRSYLHRVLGYFTDAKVAWVQAPSVYGNHEFWTARGSAEQEFVLQGPLQMGFFGFCRTPFIIGSHSTYDMSAVREIGGFQPTRAEDHLDTVYLAARGREGVFLPVVIATGDGPETLETYLAQQFAWAYSMMQVLFRFTPRLIRRYTPRQALQFLFVQTWYVLWSTSMLVLFASPLVALTFDQPVSHVEFFTFLRHSVPPSIVASVIWFWSRTWHEPKGVRLSWRGVALHVARWIVVLNALVQVILRVKKPYMITAKGIGGSSWPKLRMSVLAPYLGLIIASLAPCWIYLLVHRQSSAQGHLFFAVQGAALFWLLLAVILVQDQRMLFGLGASTIDSVRTRWIVWSSFAAASMLLTVTAIASAARIVEAIS